MKAIAVFCGSSPGFDPVYMRAANAVGRRLAMEHITLVYGGGQVGLMGAVADGALAAGGRVIGVMPRKLIEREIQHRGLTELHQVETMHERKLTMADLSDGFIALPGGAGTLEEIFEQWTWAQIGVHTKPSAFLNINGFWDPLHMMIERIVSEGFIRADHAAKVLISGCLDDILAAFRTYQPSPEKWRKDAPPA